jgi:hypothetical protein
VLGNQNLFFIAIFGSMILAPEKFQFGGANLASNFYGTEFLLTRAIDRCVLYRVKVSFLYFLIFAMPLVAILHAWKEPSLVVNEYSKIVQKDCLSAIPGSTLSAPEWNKSVPSLISIPTGNVMVAGWQLAVFFLTALFLQLLILLLYPLKKAKAFFWGLFIVFIFLPFLELRSIGQNAPTLKERLFFSFATHQVLFWVFAGLLFFLAQLWCERRFARLEQ